MSAPQRPERPLPQAERDPAWHGLDVTGEERLADPFAARHHLRRVAPVNETPLGFWRLSRYDDCVRLLREVPCGMRLRDGRALGPGGVAVEADDGFMLFEDPPVHTRLRKLVSKAFTPRAVERWRPRARQVVAERLAPALEAGEMDLIADLALPVPATLICEMLGVPVADRERFARWTSDATHGLAGELAAPDKRAAADRASLALAEYFRALIEERRGHLTDDLLSVLIRAEEDGEKLSPDELLVQSIGLLIAGFETTIGLIGNGMRALMMHPEQLARLRRRPELLANAVEESLRYEGPVSSTSRVLHADAEFGGRVIPADTLVWAMLWSANRDPERFPDPDRFDVARANARDHLAFGGGTHLCLGAHLARMEAQEAMGALVRGTRELALVEESVAWGPSLFRVPGRLPVHLRPA